MHQEDQSEYPDQGEESSQEDHGGSVDPAVLARAASLIKQVEGTLAGGGPATLLRNKALLADLAALPPAEAAVLATARRKFNEAGGQTEDFDVVMTQLAPGYAAMSNPSGEVHGYCIAEGCLSRRESHRKAVVTHQICNFTAQIVDETTRDDGVERKVSLGIIGTLRDGRTLPRIDVSGQDFGILNWIIPGWGSDAIVWPGQRLHLPAAIQSLSKEKIRTTIYTHTGWRKIEGRWVFLHAGGAIGLDANERQNVTVELRPPLANYSLPAPSSRQEAILALRASLRLLDLGPDRLTFPSVAAIYRAAIGGSDFALHVTGASGTFKSELAALVQQHFGPSFTARNLPGSWSSTGNSLEYAAFLAKDALFVVDDFAPGGSVHDVSRMHREADRLIRAQGNHSGRMRMSADGSLRPARPPRGLIFSTGEDTPRGQSLRARMLILEVSKGEIDVSKLTRCQQDGREGVYAQALVYFLNWFAPQYDAVKDSWKVRIEQTRRQVTSSDQHARTPGIVAELSAAFDLFIRSAIAAGAVTAEEAKSLLARCRKALLDAAAAQHAHQIAHEPAQHFIRLLSAAIASFRCHVADISGAPPRDPAAWGWQEREIGLGGNLRTEWHPQGKRIGWVNGNELLLEPDASYAEAQRLANEQNDSLAIAGTTLNKRLNEKKLLVSTEQSTRGTLTIRRKIEGRQRSVLHLQADALGVVDLPNPTSTDEVDESSEDFSGIAERDSLADSLDPTSVSGSWSSAAPAPAGGSPSKFQQIDADVGNVGKLLSTAPADEEYEWRF